MLYYPNSLVDVICNCQIRMFTVWLSSVLIAEQHTDKTVHLLTATRLELAIF